MTLSYRPRAYETCGTCGKSRRLVDLLHYAELSGPCPPTPTAGLGHKVLKEGMVVNTSIRQLFRPVHFSHCICHAAAKASRLYICVNGSMLWKATITGKTIYIYIYILKVYTSTESACLLF